MSLKQALCLILKPIFEKEDIIVSDITEGVLRVKYPSGFVAEIGGDKLIVPIVFRVDEYPQVLSNEDLIRKVTDAKDKLSGLLEIFPLFLETFVQPINTYNYSIKNTREQLRVVRRKNRRLIKDLKAPKQHSVDDRGKMISETCQAVERMFELHPDISTTLAVTLHGLRCEAAQSEKNLRYARRQNKRLIKRISNK